METPHQENEHNSQDAKAVDNDVCVLPMPKSANELHGMKEICIYNKGMMDGIIHSGGHSFTFRSRLRCVLHHNIVHWIVIFLIVVDALSVLFVFLLEVGALVPNSCEGFGLRSQAEYCHYHVNSRNYCGPHAQLLLDNINISAGNGGNICKCGYMSGEKICIPCGLNPAKVISGISLGILSVFMIEIAFKIVASGLKFFAHKFEALDATVVVLSWIVDVASEKEEGAFEAVSLLILLRLWRLVHVLNGVFMTSKQGSDIMKHKVQIEAHKSAEANEQCHENLLIVEEKLKKYRSLLEEHKIPLPK